MAARGITTDAKWNGPNEIKDLLAKWKTRTKYGVYQ